MDVITTAGLEDDKPSPQNPRRELLRTIGTVLRKQDASEDEYLDALDALTELSKE